MQSTARPVVKDSEGRFSSTIMANTNESLKKYFDEEGLMIPVETIIARTEAKDYRFFLESNNFLKVVDTLEKYE